MMLTTMQLHRSSHVQIMRMYLLEEKTQLRLYLRDGKAIDVPIGAVEQYQYASNILMLTVNGEKCKIYLPMGTEIDLELLYAVTRPDVRKI